jgi:imidazoleglycerol phosphate synthase glutamine amidotransferase subunit HisH
VEDPEIQAWAELVLPGVGKAGDAAADIGSGDNFHQEQTAIPDGIHLVCSFLAVDQP